MLSTWDLHGHTALVTGAGRRLGRAFAEGLAAGGADLVVHFGGSAEGAEETARRARGMGVRAVTLQCDLEKAGEAEALIGRAVEAVGEVDWLINSAAIFEALDVEGTTAEAWDRHMAINLRAPFLLAQAFARHRSGGEGTIVNILDWRALRPGADHLPYTIAKAGLAALTQSLALALAPTIRVNGLALGAVLPPSDGGGDSAIRSVPLARWARVEEAVQALLFLLAGPSFVTGTILTLDGGRRLVPAETP
ncbi:MAG TPA: SDR family oxidoreductase [Anaerolineales bacterium]|nr:SDR family oxidoreductase [Anaerolineales bacterium]